MSQTGKKYFPGDFKKSIWGNFIKNLKSADSEKEILSILNRVLSPQERINMEKRLAIIYLLAKGDSYRKISEIVDTHYSTISSVKREFKKIIDRKKAISVSEEKDWVPDFLKKSGASLFRPYRFTPKTRRKR